MYSPYLFSHQLFINLKYLFFQCLLYPSPLYPLTGRVCARDAFLCFSISVSVRHKSTPLPINNLFYDMAAWSHTLCCLMCPRAIFSFSIRSYLTIIFSLHSVFYSPIYSVSPAIDLFLTNLNLFTYTFLFDDIFCQSDNQSNLDEFKLFTWTFLFADIFYQSCNRSNLYESQALYIYFLIRRCI